jgi:hypothetical protein
MILSADDINGVLIMPNFEEAEGFKIQHENYFYDSLSALKNPIVSKITSLRELVKIHKEYGINRY